MVYDIKDYFFPVDNILYTCLLFLHGIAIWDTTGGPVFAVETVLKVQSGFSNQIISSY